MRLLGWARPNKPRDKHAAHFIGEWMMVVGNRGAVWSAVRKTLCGARVDDDTPHRSHGFRKCKRCERILAIERKMRRRA